MSEHPGEVVDLLQQMIRNECVNDGGPDSGGESRNADLLESYFAGAPVDVVRVGRTAGRDSLVARIEGSDPDAPSLLLMGHTDVVPATAEGWQHDPFGGGIHDGMVWGRGAIDMYNLTSSMAVAFRRLARTGWRPRGTLIYLAVADEEAGGTHGAQWLVDHEWDLVGADYVLTEGGGMSVTTPSGRRSMVSVAEKGMYATRITVHGTPSHGSRPYDTDNALVKAAEVVRRLSEFNGTPRIDAAWTEYVATMGYSPLLLDPDRFADGLAVLPADHARLAHALTHLTISPNVLHSGDKTNTVPGAAVLDVDVRLLPGQSKEDLLAVLAQALGSLYDEVDLEFFNETVPSTSEPDGPLWHALGSASRRLQPDVTPMPSLMTGGTDARFFRAKGASAYGFGMFSDRITLAQWQSMFHAQNERVDLESLRLSVDLWEMLARELLE
ncbi:M20/M25/M40 family metallo-hydrolase [Amycolatopsis jejuensis]|uniref:M20/M25/M40 family metallo-hydrolase n=1 Tax=Amycolatopsis jejuensis TaxID=330084 RepID=UPI0005276F76|nr:M20/M25/M40 family metallo-hydrolase [Amycolatopsis jejuensis]